MRTFILLSLAAAASAADFIYPTNIVGTPGVDTIPERCVQDYVNKNNDCPAKLKSGNILIPAFHQALDERKPDEDTTAPSNALAVNVNDGKELRSLAIIPDFPKSAEGKKCAFRMFSNGGTADGSPEYKRVAIWSLKPGKVANLETTWNSRPDRDQKVAVFSNEKTDNNVSAYEKRDWIAIEGPAYPLSETFDCPKPGSHVAWEVALDIDLRSVKNPFIINLGGINGLGIEVIGVKQQSYAGNHQPNDGNSTTTPGPTNSDSSFKFPTDLAFIPGTDKVATTPQDCVKNPTLTPCVTRLTSGNIIVPAYHQALLEANPDTDSTQSNNGVTVGVDILEKEKRTLAIIPSFPASGEGKKCSFHFITNDGVNLASSSVPSIALWSLKTPKSANLETTWNSRPEREKKIAVWDMTAKFHDNHGKYSHIATEGPAYPLTQTFDCPKAGSHVAWELALNAEKADHIAAKKNKDTFFAGGMLGLGIEIIGAKQTAYSNATATATWNTVKSTAMPTAKPTQYVPSNGLPMQNVNAASALSVSMGAALAGFVSTIVYALL